MDDVNVRITEGVFKGIEGVLTSYDVKKAEVKVDYDNTIIVNSNQIESLEEEYLIYVTFLYTDRLVTEYPPYVIKLDERSVGAYVNKVDEKINPKKDTQDNIYFYGFERYPTHVIPYNKYSVTAIPVSKVKTDFKINGLDIDTKALSGIINKLK